MKRLLTILVLFCSLLTQAQVHPTIGTGEYAGFFTDKNSHLWGLSNNNTITGTHSSGTDGVLSLVRCDTANLQFIRAYGALHGGAAISFSHWLYTIGDNSDGQLGLGDASSHDSAMRVMVDSAGNPFNNIVDYAAYFISNSFNGFFAIKGDGTLWMAGNTQNGIRSNGTAGQTLSKPVQVLIPGGRLAKQIVGGHQAILLCTDGTVWTWGPADSFADLGYAGSGSQYMSIHQITLSHIAFIAGGQNWNWAYDSTNVLRSWGGWGEMQGHADGNPISTPTIATDSIVAYLDGTNIADIKCNSLNTVFLMTSGRVYTMGDNVMGGVGIGSEINWNTYTTSPAPTGGTSNPWAWDFSRGNLSVVHPQRCTNKSNFAAITGVPMFNYYTYLIDANDSIWVFGRNKGSVICNRIKGPNGDIIGQYANSWDVIWPTPVHPFAFASPFISTSPWCLSHSGATFCSEFSPPANTGPTAVVSNITIFVPNTILTQASTDNVFIYKYVWTVLNGTGNVSVNADPSALFSGLASPSIDTLKLVVTDNGFLSDSAKMIVTVSPDTIPKLTPSLGTLITLPTNSATVSVAAVAYNTATISSYSWAKTAGPGTFTITSPTATSTTVTGLVAGLYVFTVTVTDSHGNTNTATVTVVVHAASGTQYSFYFASAANGGSDANACTIGSPCLSISKMNTVAAARVAGDSVLFNASDTIYGQFLPGNNSSYGGAYGIPIWFGRYGTGANFVFTGFSTVTGWTQEGATNIYKAPCPLCKTSLNLVTIDGLPVPMARYPNPGQYLVYNTTATDTLQVVPALTGTPVITGSWEVIRAGNFSWLVDSVTSVSGDSVRRTGSIYSHSVNGYSLFFEKSHAFLDTLGEWFYDVSTGNLEVYYPGGPSAHVVKAATMDTVIYSHISEHDLTFDSLQVIGSNQQGFNSSEFFNGGRITWQNSNFDFHGGNAISNNSNLSPLPTMSVINCTFNHCYNDAIYSQGSLFGNYFGHNTITNTGMMLGAGGSSFGDECAIYCTAVNTIYEYNNISTSGYCGINWVGDSSYLRFNYIQHSCKWLDDGGALYTFRNSGAVHVWQWVYSNVLVNDATDLNNANEARPSGNISLVMGDYHDQQSSQITDSANTIVGFVGGGINLNEVNHINIVWNTLYDNDSAAINVVGRSTPSSNIRLSHNIIGVTNPAEQLIHVFSTLNNLSTFFVSGSPDSNYYCSSSPLFSAVPSNGGYATLNLAGWRAVYPDVHSQLFATPSLFQSNPTNATLPFGLSGIYSDVFGSTFNSTINIAPYSSAMLFFSQRFLGPIKRGQIVKFH